jgi:putative SOS response-associated peptidase YedK
MCGRYYIAISDDELRDIGEEAEKLVNAFNEPIPLKTRGEIFPTDVVPVQTGKNRFVPMKWGFTGYNKKAVINARSETVLEKPMFKKPMLESRCLIPASGYYEWRRAEGEKIKYQFYAPEGPVFFAGCYRQEAGSPLRNFVILTRQAVNGLEAFHDRMPVIIPAGLREKWLYEDPRALESAIVDLIYKPAA